MSDITKQMISDIVAWDIPNWWRAIKFWEPVSKDVTGKKVLDLGGRSGRLSLLWALKGAREVVCSDINSDSFDKARELHRKYGVEEKVRYEIIDATEIPYTNEFDIVCFKSVLGGVGANNNYMNQREMMNSIYKALRSDGKLVFCENMTASPIHNILRKYFTSRYGIWRYISLSELYELTNIFSKLQYSTYGYFGVFGRNKLTNQLLSSIDNIIDCFVKEDSKYIVSCICQK